MTAIFRVHTIRRAKFAGEYVNVLACKLVPKDRRELNRLNKLRKTDLPKRKAA